MKISTQAAQIGVGWDTGTGAVTVPIYQTATFCHPGLGKSTGYDYSRTRNPTRQVLEDAIALLEGAARGFAFSSGMAAITTLLLLFKSGDHLVVTEDLYGGTYRLFQQCFSQYGMSFSYVDTTSPDAVKKAVRPETRAFFIESLTNPLLKVTDIAGLSAIAKDRGFLTIVDNTFLTPYLLRPLDLGADITMYSGTKYLSGHNDTVCGLLAVKEPALAEKVGFHQNAAGAVLGPQDSWLTIRGMKTLSVRLDRQQENAAAIAPWLARHPKVSKVYYPGLPGHPGHELAARQGRGFGAMISFEVKDPSLVETFLGRTKLVSFAESLGGVETLVTFPAVQTHAEMEPATRERLGISPVLLRLSVGIEDAEDLIDDLGRSLG
ncbi:MAG: PLP-dependent aspartate aminotransferase family protein [Spirochaetia bacterium]|jgi:cystathionine gamma-synthase/cystathionine beta-lyase